MKLSTCILETIRELYNSSDIFSLRAGQICFNKLNLLYPELANLIAGTDYDPFYHDDRINGFLKVLDEIESMNILDKLNKLDENVSSMIKKVLSKTPEEKKLSNKLQAAKDQVDISRIVNTSNSIVNTSIGNISTSTSPALSGIVTNPYAYYNNNTSVSSTNQKTSHYENLSDTVYLIKSELDEIEDWLQEEQDSILFTGSTAFFGSGKDRDYVIPFELWKTFKHSKEYSKNALKYNGHNQFGHDGFEDTKIKFTLRLLCGDANINIIITDKDGYECWEYAHFNITRMFNQCPTLKVAAQNDKEIRVSIFKYLKKTS